MVSGLVKIISITAKPDGTVFKDFTSMYKPKKASFQTSVPCANSIKMKTHFQFILMNWSITLPKMVRNNILEE